MPKIETKVGRLERVDTDKQTIDIKLQGSGGLVVPRIVKEPAPHVPQYTTYKYNLIDVEVKDENFCDKIGERVKIRLENNIVTKIELA